MIIIVLSIIESLVTVVTVLSICKPIEAQWNPSAGKCAYVLVLMKAVYFISATSIFTDFSGAILPVVLLWSVQLNWKIKITIAGILSFGIVYVYA